ncbi:Spo0E family sporulation regulatory protein-aspartic acid phosphatase [Clostridium sp.]|uniref:Spo0E family sporulation regulatory protein-aspartic acid phosphatase n=1 Tax=Clostridium sp. TaxID=1506 RepID=UPI0035A138BA
MKEMLEKVRDKLNFMLDSDKFTDEEILAVSQELDRLILTYYELNSLNLPENSPKLKENIAGKLNIL